MSDTDIDDGRIPLSPPSAEALEKAAEDVLGPTAPECLFEGGSKLFRGMGGFFLQGPEESVGVTLPQAAPDLQEILMSEATKVRKAQAEEELARFRDPARNPFIRGGD